MKYNYNLCMLTLVQLSGRFSITESQCSAISTTIVIVENNYCNQILGDL